MKFFKVILNTVGKDNEKVFFIVPPAEEKDENGNPAYDEDFLLSNAEYKSYLKETNAAVVSVTYILYEADDRTKLNYDELLKSESSFFKLEQNEYLIEVKKAKPKGGSGKKSSSAVIYVVLGIVAVAIVAMLIYGSSLKKDSGDPADSGSDTSDISVDTNSTPSETEEPTPSGEGETSEDTAADLTAPTENENTPGTTSSSEISTTTEISNDSTLPELVTLTFDKNGGAGALTENTYQAGTVVSLPFSGISRVGYSLVGWATAPTEPYTLYDNELNRLTMPESPLTLYAVWTATEYEVTYNYQVNGNAVTSKERAKYGELIRLMEAASIPSGTDGEFIGWGLTPDDTEPVQSLTMPDGGIELYAIYKMAE